MQRTDEANIVLVHFVISDLLPQLREGVDDDPENDVQKDNVDDHEARDIIEKSDNVLSPVARRVGLSDHHISDTAGRPRPEREHREETLEHVHALVFSRFAEIRVPDSVDHEEIAQAGVDVGDHNSEQDCQNQLDFVVGDGFDHILQSLESVLKLKGKLLTTTSNKENE